MTPMRSKPGDWIARINPARFLGPVSPGKRPLSMGRYVPKVHMSIFFLIKRLRL